MGQFLRWKGRTSPALRWIFCPLPLVWLFLPALAVSRTNLLPGLEDNIQRLRFHTGRSINNRPEISSILPEIPGLPSEWWVTQWGHKIALQPDQMTLDNSSTRDVLLGLPKYSFKTKDGNLRLSIFEDRATNEPVYDLFERDGNLTAAGGANLFLGRDAPEGGIPMNQQLQLRFRAKISNAHIFGTIDEQARGTILAQVFAGFVVRLGEHDNKPSTLFLQIPISGSRKQPSEYKKCSSTNGQKVFIFDPSSPEYPLAFKAVPGSLQTIEFDITKRLCEFALKRFKCEASDGSTAEWSFERPETVLQDSKITSFYIGLETQNQDARANSTAKPEGHVSVGLQIAKVQLLAIESSQSRPCAIVPH
jgi:hypothetical protein